MTYTLEKAIWTDEDFAVMSFHDVRIRSWLADEERFELMFDLDYLFQWVHPDVGETYFRFWIAPVTLVFEDVHDVRIDVSSAQGALEIDRFHREEPTPTPNGVRVERKYVFSCQEGEISLVATGYAMYVRRAPILWPRQQLALEERGGVSFARVLSND